MGPIYCTISKYLIERYIYLETYYNMLCVRGHIMSASFRRRYILTLVMVIATILSVLLPVLGASSGPEIFKYDEKRTGISQLTSNIVEPESRWILDLGAPAASFPVVGDVDGDGNVEIIYGTADGRICALNGGGEEKWSTQVTGPFYAPAAMGDIDGDGNEEVVIGGFYFNSGDPNLYALNGEDGSILWTFSTLDKGALFEKGFESAPSLYDINDDGALDVLIGSRNYYFYALDGTDGSVIWKSQFEHYIRASTPVGDIDNDGKDEILVGDNHALARLFEMDGTLDWEMYMGYGIVGTPVFADLNGDSFDEIIVFSYGRVFGGILGVPRVYKHDGTLLWENTDYTFFYTSPTLFDVDGDGLLDVINVDSNDQVLIAYKGTDGSILYTSEPFEKNFMNSGIFTADIDGDGETELLIGATPNLYSINAADGSVEWVYYTNNQRVSGPLIADLDGDGLAEILIRVTEKLICLQNANGPMDLLDKIIEYILGLDDECFKNNADNRKNALVNKLEAVRQMIIDGDYEGAIDKLINDIRPKMDGEGKNDWIICENAQNDLTGMIDELIEYLESL
jgi:outer membrane protein assembly factor BamB